jgi:sigma-E factor negative regulatory protein RseA
MEPPMDTHKKMREHISALSDGELATTDVELALAALQGADGEQAWNTYHRIGDVLRGQASPELSDGFSARLAARLAAEPAPAKRIATIHNGVASTSTASTTSTVTAPAPKPAVATTS